jgi:hypothetical protein
MYQGNDPTVKEAFLVHWDVPRDFAIFMLEENEQTPQQALSIENLSTTSLINYTPQRIFTVGYPFVRRGIGPPRPHHSKSN